jgi:hypothetical protein
MTLPDGSIEHGAYWQLNYSHLASVIKYCSSVNENCHLYPFPFNPSPQKNGDFELGARCETIIILPEPAAS